MDLNNVPHAGGLGPASGRRSLIYRDALLGILDIPHGLSSRVVFVRVLSPVEASYRAVLTVLVFSRRLWLPLPALRGEEST